MKILIAATVCVLFTAVVGTAAAAEDAGMHGGMDMSGGMEMSDGISHEEASGMTMLEGTEVRIMASEPAETEMMEVKVMFVDAMHVNYDIIVEQNGDILLDQAGVHSHTGMETHLTDRLLDESPVDVIITFQGYGIDEKTGPIGTKLVFAQIVPEFGAVAALVLAAAIVTVVAFSARPGLGIIPRH